MRLDRVVQSSAGSVRSRNNMVHWTCYFICLLLHLPKERFPDKMTFYYSGSYMCKAQNNSLLLYFLHQNLEPYSIQLYKVSQGSAFHPKWGTICAPAHICMRSMISPGCSSLDCVACLSANRPDTGSSTHPAARHAPFGCKTTLKHCT